MHGDEQLTLVEFVLAEGESGAGAHEDPVSDQCKGLGHEVPLIQNPVQTLYRFVEQQVKTQTRVVARYTGDRKFVIFFCAE
ncbi:MAG: hypothetical protein ABIF77_04540 [bacterium]